MTFRPALLVKITSQCNDSFLT